MKKTIETDIDIDASPEKVWKVLTDLTSYPQWNPFILEISGKLKVGEKLSVLIRPEGGREMTFKPVVTVADINRELRWLGRLFFNKLFDGEHYFRIEQIGDESVRFVHGENFNCILVRLFASSLEKGTAAGFRAMNKAIKVRAESVIEAGDVSERATISDPHSAWRKMAASASFEEAEPWMLAATAGDDPLGDLLIAKAEFYEAWGDHLAPDPSAAEKYALSHAEWAWYASCSTSGGEGTARMLAVNRVDQKIAALHHV